MKRKIQIKKMTIYSYLVMFTVFCELLFASEVMQDSYEVGRVVRISDYDCDGGRAFYFKANESYYKKIQSLTLIAKKKNIVSIKIDLDINNNKFKTFCIPEIYLKNTKVKLTYKDFESSEGYTTIEKGNLISLNDRDYISFFWLNGAGPSQLFELQKERK